MRRPPSPSWASGPGRLLGRSSLLVGAGVARPCPSYPFRAGNQPTNGPKNSPLSPRATGAGQFVSGSLVGSGGPRAGHTSSPLQSVMGLRKPPFLRLGQTGWTGAGCCRSTQRSETAKCDATLAPLEGGPGRKGRRCDAGTLLFDGWCGRRPDGPVRWSSVLPTRSPFVSTSSCRSSSAMGPTP